jgi:hypothetical protein
MQNAKDHINRLRLERSKDRKLRFNSMMQSKLEAAGEVRQVKTDGANFKAYYYDMLTKDNIQRNSTIKQERAQGFEHVSAFRQQRQREARESIRNKIEEEERQKQETSLRLEQMEALELELIARLQNTQQLQQKAYSELERALNRGRQIGARSEPS